MIIERAVIRVAARSLNRTICLRSGPWRLSFGRMTAPFDRPFDAAVAALERELNRRALVAASGNRTDAARRLQINRRLLYSQMREYELC
jgi:DNA-binding NtrC family response regulator